MNIRSRDIPELTLERLVAGDLPKDRALALQKQIEASPLIQARFDKILASNQAILSSLPAEGVSREVSSRLRQLKGDEALNRSSKLGILASVTGAVALAAALFMVMPTSQTAPTVASDSLEVTRVKGLLPSIMIHRRTDKDVERLQSGDQAKSGDVLQVSYQSAGKPFGLILSIDGRGIVTLHHPSSSKRPPVLTTSGDVSLPRSYELDDAPNYERFFLITAPEPFAVDTVIEAAEAIADSSDTALNAPLILPEHIEQVDFTVRKLP